MEWYGCYWLPLLQIVKGWALQKKGKKVQPGLFNLELRNKLMKQTHLWQWASWGDSAVGLLCSYPASHDIHDTPLSETDTGETNLLSDQVWQSLHKAVRPDCFAWALDTWGVNNNFIHFPHSHFQPGEDENLLSISGVKLRQAEQLCRGTSSAFPYQLSWENLLIFFPSSPEAKSTNIMAAYTLLPKPCWQFFIVLLVKRFMIFLFFPLEPTLISPLSFSLPLPTIKKGFPFAARDNQKLVQYPAASPQPVEIPTLLPQHPKIAGALQSPQDPAGGNPLLWNAFLKLWIMNTWSFSSLLLPHLQWFKAKQSKV